MNLIKKEEKFMKDFKMRPCLSTYIILGTIFGFLIGGVLAGVLSVILNNSTNFAITLGILCGFIVEYILLFNYKVEIKNTTILAKKSLTNFNTQRILINEIKKITLIKGFNKNAKNGFYTLNIIGEKNTISINIKPFGKKDLMRFIQQIYNYNHDIELDEYTKNWLNNKFIIF